MEIKHKTRLSMFCMFNLQRRCTLCYLSREVGENYPDKQTRISGVFILSRGRFLAREACLFLFTAENQYYLFC